MALLIAGGVLLGLATGLDLMFRIRMARLGDWAVFLKGGSFNYSEYHRVRVENGWDAWPVWAMWTLYIFGIGLLVGGFFVYFGTRPQAVR